MDKKTEQEGGGEGTPGAELSREEVMAQRAAKKKLKEARKNKSGGGATPGGDGEPGTPAAPKQQTPKPKKPQNQQQQQSSETPKSKNPQQQQQKQGQQKQGAAETPKASKGAGANKPQDKAKSPTPTPSSEAKSPSKSVGKGDTPAPATTTGAPLATDNAAVTSTTKSETPERTTTKAPIELQSTIQSLFQVKRTPEVSKNKKIQIHPLFHSLGVKLRHNVIRGTNQRCVTLLHTIKKYVESYQTPSGVSFKHGLSDELRQNLDLLREKCPFAIGMNNAVDFLNAFLYKMEQDVIDIRQQKEQILDIIDQYIEEKIEKAVEAIVMYGVDKVKDGDAIMLFSITEAVLSLLEKAAEKDEKGERKNFELIIIQTPETILDIPIVLKKLSEPINEQAIIISSVSFPNAIYRMRHCTKLVIGGHGLFTTGGVMAQSGSGQLALLANSFNKPTIFLCETYKFCDRSPLDFFTLDEYIPEQAITQEDLFQPKIKYDVTPANLVTVVITDIDLLPSTSVPVVLRLQ